MRLGNFQQGEITEILEQEDLVLRNLQITLGYYRIAQGLQQVIGDQDVNWFYFGCYASKTAGQALRHELFPKPLKSMLVRAAGFGDTDEFFDSALVKDCDEEPEEEENILAEILSDVSLLVSEGNYLIFSELAWPYSVFIDRFSNDQHSEWGKLEAFLDEFLDPRQIGDGGQAYLREAFIAFYTARFELDPKKKVEWVLLGNLMTGFHEQTRVQPIIEKALGTPFDVITEEIFEDDDVKGSRIGKPGNLMLHFSRNLVLKIITQMWMTYALPEGEIKLGDDVAAPSGSRNFPDDLINLENPRTIEVVQKFDKNLASLEGSAADNWGSLEERMTFLADFFRSYQRYKPLFLAPFLENQILSLLDNRVPEGSL